MNLWLLIIPICFVAVVWAVFREIARFERHQRTVRPLTSDEKAAWGLYRIEDAVKVHRMKLAREFQTHLWEMKLRTLQAHRYWLGRAIRPFDQRESA